MLLSVWLERPVSGTCHPVIVSLSPCSTATLPHRVWKLCFSLKIRIFFSSVCDFAVRFSVGTVLLLLRSVPLAVPEVWGGGGGAGSRAGPSHPAAGGDSQGPLGGQTLPGSTPHLLAPGRAAQPCSSQPGKERVVPGSTPAT